MSGLSRGLQSFSSIRGRRDIFRRLRGALFCGRFSPVFRLLICGGEAFHFLFTVGGEAFIDSFFVFVSADIDLHGIFMCVFVILWCSHIFSFLYASAALTVVFE